MNKLQKIEKIRQFCIAANESIKSLKKGCLISIKDWGTGEYSDHWRNGKAPIHHESSGYYVIKHGVGWDGRYVESKCIYEYSDGNKQENKDVEIIGREIRLTDIMKVIHDKKSSNKTNVILEIDGQFIVSGYDKEISHLRGTYIKWDLHKDSLSDQPEPTFDFIISLIDTK